MIPLDKYKKMLEEEVQGLNDKEIEEIYNAQYQFSEIAFEIWAKEKGLKTNK